MADRPTEMVGPVLTRWRNKRLQTWLAYIPGISLPTTLMTPPTLQNKVFLLLLALVTIAFGAILWQFHGAVFWGVILAI